MPVLKRELHQTAKGPAMSGEDRWRLVFDTDSKRLYVEHVWEHVDPRRGGAVSTGRAEADVVTFLKQPGQGPAHRELLRLLSGLFGDKPNA
jgi:hypothetical protein